ncbi:MAG: ATP-grasp domain-containing protein [Chloroflexota bacterium]|nr:ATP-grasp domain-containing protein [Chloroflexota bacterium]
MRYTSSMHKLAGDATRTSSRSTMPLACVIGTVDLLRPLGLAGIKCAVVARPGSPKRYSRFVNQVVDWADPWKQPDELLEGLVRFGTAQENRPVLYYEGDWDLLLVSRRRERLAKVFRFVLPDATLVEDLVDKDRFRAVAERLSLPVPKSRRLSPEHARPDDVDLRFPLIVKPLTRQMATWDGLADGAKALEVETLADLRRAWRILARADVEILAQELIPGPETLIESYHVYVDEQGDRVAEFTGKKIRTFPAAYGHSTALVITRASDVLALGRQVVHRLDLRGVAKLDFKRGSDGRLHLLEINPRFSLWHHLGAKAGLNLPQLVYDDLVGLPRKVVGSAHPGVRWCNVHDWRAAREAGMPLHRWLRWALTCEAKSGLAWDDPLPIIGGLGFAARASSSALRARFRHRVR